MAQLSMSRGWIEFHPTILRNVTNAVTGWAVLGESVTSPFGIAPTEFTRLMHTESEITGARSGHVRNPVLAVHPTHVLDPRCRHRCFAGPQIVSVA